MYAKLSIQETAERVDVDIKNGLSSAEVTDRLNAGGSNAIAEGKRRDKK